MSRRRDWEPGEEWIEWPFIIVVLSFSAACIYYLAFERNIAIGVIMYLVAAAVCGVYWWLLEALS